MKISEQIIEVIEILCEKFGIVIDWSAETIMPYIQTLIERYTNYVVGTRIFGVSFCLIALFITTIVYLSWRKNELEYHENVHIAYGIILAILVITNLIVIPVLGTQLFEAIYMPEVSLIKYIQGHINTH